MNVHSSRTLVCSREEPSEARRNNDFERANKAHKKLDPRSSRG